MSFFHGVKTSEVPTSINTPVVAGCGIPFVVGTAPIHMVHGKTNELIMAQSYKEAVEQIGYSEDWKKYTLCEFVYCQFQLYGVAPVIMVNVLDPAKHKKAVEKSQVQITDKQIKLPLEVIEDSLKVYENESETALVKDTDYSVFYDDSTGKFIIEVLDGGSVYEAVTLYVQYDVVDPEMVTKADIIGGYSISSGRSTGVELLNSSFFKFNIIPDLILAPGWSHDSEVAAILLAKANVISSLFQAKALLDADCEVAKKYSDVTEWKSKNNIFDKNQILFWPCVGLGGKIYHLSTHMAGLMGKTDVANDDCPGRSPSNKALQIDSICLPDGEEILQNLEQANYLNSNGVCTALNFYGGFKAWGNYTACYPAVTDVKDYFMNVSRTFAWIAKTFILTYWGNLDDNITPRFLDTIIDSFNIYLNGLTAAEKLLGGRIVALAEENPLTDLMAGKIKFHVYITPPSPAQEIQAAFEYDVSYIDVLFAKMVA